jgi:exodeoxyribonuclease III
MKIATWNVNSIRKRLPLVLEWLTLQRPDVLCLQETKVQDDEFPAEAIRAAGYHVSFRGRKGYNGVATLSLLPPEAVMHGLHEGADVEDDRILQTRLSGIRILNTYVPQGFKVGTDKFAAKLQWFARLRTFLEDRLDPADPVVWLGDLNVAPEPIDVYHPDRRINDPDFHIDARNAYKAARDWGFTDVYRALYPDRVQYTYWDYYRNSFEHNWGWRIDHILVTSSLARICRTAEVDLEPRKSAMPSDHTVVWAEFAL